MPQLSLYLDDETMNDLRTNAQRENISLSKYVAGLLKDSKCSQNWIEEWLNEVYGCIPNDYEWELPEDPPALPFEVEHPEFYTDSRRDDDCVLS